MAGFNGKWVLDQTENDVKFMEEIGYSQDVITACLPLYEKGVEIEYDTDAKSYVHNIIRAKGIEMFNHTTPLGNNFDITDDTGTKSTILEHSVTDDQILLKQKGPNGKIATFDTRLQTNDEVTEVMTVEGSDVVAKRTLKRISGGNTKEIRVM